MLLIYRFEIINYLQKYDKLWKKQILINHIGNILVYVITSI
jgi:hypothetical protein